MRISQLARHCGVSSHTIRFYERKGLLPEPERSPAGYRCYTPEAAFAVRNIRALQAFGFTLDDILELVEHERVLSAKDLSSAAKSSAHETVLSRAGARLSKLNQHIRDLGEKKRALEHLIETMATSRLSRQFILPTEVAGLRGSALPAQIDQCKEA